MAARKTLLDSRGPKVIVRDRPVRASRVSALDEETKGEVYRHWLLGVSLDILARQHGCSPGAIERVVNDMRAARILEQKLEYMYDPSFDQPGAAASILGPMPEAPVRKTSSARLKPPVGVPPYLASLYSDAPLLTREQEAYLFRRMNFLKYQASKIRDRISATKAKEADLDEIERLQEEALTVKNQIIRSNLRLVVSIAKKRVGPTNNFFELVSDGNMSLIRAVEKFDFSRGFKFSTYASWAIMKNFARSIPEEIHRRDRFVTGHDEMFDAAADHRSDEYETESDHRRNQETVQGMLGRLNDRERQILIRRYGIGGTSEQTLEQLGRELGITKERVRQIESRAQEKLRQYARERKLDPPAA